MAVINVRQSSLLHFQDRNNQKRNNIFKSNYSISPKLTFNSSFTQLKYSNHQNAPTKSLLKPFMKPLSEPLLQSTQVNFNSEPQFFGGRWGETGSSSGSDRADFRVWSRRRPGSKTKDKRLSIDLECTECLKHRYTTKRHKDFARRKTEKENHNNKKASISDHEKNDETLNEKEAEKEKCRVKREAEKKAVNNSNLLLLFKFCPKCRKPTLHKELNTKRK